MRCQGCTAECSTLKPSSVVSVKACQGKSCCLSRGENAVSWHLWPQLLRYAYESVQKSIHNSCKWEGGEHTPLIHASIPHTHDIYISPVCAPISTTGTTTADMCIRLLHSMPPVPTSSMFMPGTLDYHDRVDDDCLLALSQPDPAQPRFIDHPPGYE